jgi:hypothetical protein
MEKDFDNEIDAILRGAAKGINLTETLENHLDADEISLFAEGLLPMNARLAAIEHFADCSNCRSVLVDVVSIQEDSANAPSVDLIGTKTGFAESLRNWFTFSNLGFAMGALSLVFVGIIGFVAIQNNQPSGDQAKLETKSIAAPPVNANKPVISESNEPVTSTNSAANSAPLAAANAAASVANTAPKAPIDSDTINRSPISADAKPRGPNAKSESDLPIAKQPLGKNKAIEREESPIAKEPAKTESLNAAPNPAAESKVDDSANADKEVTRSAPEKPKKSAAPATTAGASDSNVQRARSVAGKSFAKSDGTWIDSAYKGGATRTVNRGTKEFDELDSGLKSIANSLAEPVVVVWKAKNYRIQ